MMNQVGEEFSAMVTGFSNRRVFFETEEHIEVSWDVVSARHFMNLMKENMRCWTENRKKINIIWG